MENLSNKCVICGDMFSPVSRNYQRHKVFTPEDNAGLSHQLSVILLLRKILKLSPAHLEALLKEWGNPSGWGITMCLPCNRIFREAEFVHDRILCLHREFDDLCNEIRGQLKESVDENPGVNSGTNRRRKTGALAASDKDKSSDIRSLPPKQVTNFQVVEDIRQFVGTNTHGTKVNVNIIVRTHKQLKRTRSSLVNSEPPDLTPEIVTKDENYYKNRDCDNNENESESTKKRKLGTGSLRKRLRRVKYSQSSAAPDIASNDAFTSKLIKKENENGDMQAEVQGSSDVEMEDRDEASTLFPESVQQDDFEDSASDLNSDSDKGSTENDANDPSCSLLKDADNANDDGVDKPKTPHSWVRKHQCKKCPRNPYFKSAFTLEAHDKHVHLGIDRPFQCEKCTKNFKLLRHYNEHQRFHQRELRRSKKPTYCAECDQHFKNNARLTIHLNSTHNPAKSPYIWARTYQCKKCPARNSYFKSAFTLEAHHKQVHMGIKRPFQCDKCDKDFATLKNYNQHQVFHQKQITHPKKPKPETYCAECDHHFLTNSSLRTHLASGVHNSAKSFLCELCTKAFYTETSLENHRVLYHHKELGIDPFKCPHCEQALGTKRSLDNHIRSKHTLDTKFKCPHCPSGFMFKGTLKNHINAVHEKAKLYTCPYCPKVFPVNWYLTTHLRIHTGKKPYKCRICSKEFSDSPTYRRHVEAHRGILHTCLIETCRKQYNTRHALRVHMKAHGKSISKEVTSGIHDQACNLSPNDAQLDSTIQNQVESIPMNNDFTSAIYSDTHVERC